ncbi:propionate catabolism operon regulatory protein PrpR [Uliginosibacterium sp. sgz301328]|uniref:propionate catabolism operon regulatory protein PrpR n=1 Tax=Uliginosibacterium sp. sgz301328 TaxID=3243764 RepID=UPI00359E9479
MSPTVHRPRLCVVSFSRLSALIESVGDDYADQADIVVEHRRFGDAVAQARSLIERGDVDVFISAGANGALLRRQLEYPVALVNVTGYDIMRALSRAAGMGDHVGLVTYEPISPDLGDLGRLLRIRLDVRRYTSEHDVQAHVRALRDAGAQVVIGTSLVTETAEQHGLQSVFIYTPESARRAIEEAIELARVRAVERARREQLATLLGHVREGIVAVDAAQQVWLANPAACDLLGAPAQAVIGRSLGDVMPQVDVRDALGKDARPLLRRVFSVGARRVIGNIIPIDEQSAQPGALLTLQEAASVERADRDLRRHAHSTPLRAKHALDDLVGVSDAMGRLRALAERFASLDLTVLITGESGTGKELIAQGLHNASARRRGPFVAINCAAMPESLLEAELFGYEEGAFTGASRGGKPGLLEAAHRGSVFLDEIGDMPLALQTRLLRVLQEREVLRVGGREPIPIDVRIVAATHRDLSQRVQDGAFRQDLYYRLNGLRLVVPSLRERIEDLPALIDALVAKHAGRHGLQRPDAMLLGRFLERTRAYTWPGNVRELENMVERLMAAASEPDANLRAGLLTMLFPELEGTSIVQDEAPLRRARRELDRREARVALAEAGGNATLAARRLGVGRTTLWRLLKEGQ